MKVNLSQMTLAQVNTNLTGSNMSHLYKFSALVWILSQGQNIAQKILPKSEQCSYVGYNDRSKSVLYYNTETRKSPHLLGMQLKMGGKLHLFSFACDFVVI